MKKEEIGMEKKKIVSIEDRIPKLKQARKKKANRRSNILSVYFFHLNFHHRLFTISIKSYKYDSR